MSKSKSLNDKQDPVLDEYYIKTVTETKSYIQKLKDLQTKKICRRWIEKLNSAINQRVLRNQYIHELNRRLKAGTDLGAFSIGPPLKGLLPPLPCEEVSTTEPDSLSEYSGVQKQHYHCEQSWMRCKACPQEKSIEDRIDEITSQDDISEKVQKEQLPLEEKPLRGQLHICEQKIDELTNSLRNSQAENHNLKQELWRRQEYEDPAQLYHFREVIKHKNEEINDWKSRLVKVQQMKEDLEECHQKIIHQCRSAINNQYQRFNSKLVEKEMQNETLREEIIALTQKVEAVSRDKDGVLRLQQKDFDELLQCKERSFDSKCRNLESINRDLMRKNESNEENIHSLHSRVQELETKLQLKTDEQAKLQTLLSEQCSTMRDEFSKIRSELDAVNQQQIQELTQKVSILKKSILKLEKSRQKVILQSKQKIFEIEKGKEIEMKALELQLQGQRNELSTSLSTEKQCELDSLVTMLEERYKGFVASTEAMADCQRQKYLQKMTELEDQLSRLKDTLIVDETYV